MLSDPRAHYSLIDSVYRFVLGRPADQEGLIAYAAQLGSEPTIGTLTSIIVAMAASDEATARRSAMPDTVAAL